MKWTKKVQVQGRVQIPVPYLKSFDIKIGDEVSIEETEEELALLVKFMKKGKSKK